MERQGRPSVMLIPDVPWWVLGTWAQEIRKWNSDRYDILVFPSTRVHAHPAIFLDLAAQMDVIQVMSPHEFPNLSELLGTHGVRPSLLVSSLNHIVTPDEVECVRAADRIMVMCSKYYRELAELGIPEERLFLVRHGMDTDLFAPGDRSASRQLLDIFDDSFAVGFSGKAASEYGGRKGVDFLGDIMSLLSSRIGEKLRLVVTGPGWEDLLNRPPLDAIQSSYFSFLPRESMPDLFRSLDVLLVTSRAEGGPVPMLEAMSCGTPCVVTPVGVVPDTIETGVNGFVCDFGDAEGFAAAIERLYRDPEYARRIGEAARQTIVDKLQWKDVAPGMNGLYELPEGIIGGQRLRVPSGELERLNRILISDDTGDITVEQPKLVTVLMSVHNGEKYIREAIDSVLGQTYPHFELLIVDDCSTDATPEILARYRDTRIRVVRNETNLGLTKSLNRGLGLARGEYVARLDADDVSMPERLARQVEYLDQHPKIGLLTTRLASMDAEGVIFRESGLWGNSPEEYYYETIFHNCFAHSTAMYRRNLVLGIGGYDEEIRVAQDWDLWGRISLAACTHLLDEVLLHYRDISTSISNTRVHEYRRTVPEIFRRNVSRTAGGGIDHRKLLPLHLNFHPTSVPWGWEKQRITSSAVRELKKMHSALLANCPKCLDESRLSAVCEDRLARAMEQANQGDRLRWLWNGLGRVRAGFTVARDIIRRLRPLAGRVRRRLLSGKR